MKDILDKSLEILGDESMIIAMEELAELQQAISKMLRGKDVRNNLIEEIADVFIILEWILKQYSITHDELDDCYAWKMNRMKERIENNELKINK